MRIEILSIGGSVPSRSSKPVCEKIEADVSKVLGVPQAVAAFQTYGSGGKEAVLAQLHAWQDRLRIAEEASRTEIARLRESRGFNHGCRTGGRSDLIHA